MVPESAAMAGRRKKQVNVLCASMLTPGDTEAIKEWIEAFGLRPVLLPDIGDSLDGHLVDAETTPLTLGGTPRNEIAAMGESAATLVIGRSLHKAADLLKQRTGVPDFRFDHLLGWMPAMPSPWPWPKFRASRCRRRSTGSAHNCRTRWSIPTS
jgi:nitrogenase molybdenum-iron protein NifN